MEKGENNVYGNDRDDIFSKSVRAGKRTYFFDVKSTRKNDYYLTITESKKRIESDGGQSFEKHKIFLYREDFEKFMDGLTEVFDYIQNNLPDDYSSESDDFNYNLILSKDREKMQD